MGRKQAGGKLVEFGKVRQSKFPELNYQLQGPGNWRLLDADTGAAVGPPYPTYEAMESDLDRQYRARYVHAAEPDPVKHWLDVIRDQLADIVKHYEKSAPAVADWADGLYIRTNETPHLVTLVELLAVSRLCEDESWMQANFAANAVYKVMRATGQDTTGLAGY